MRYVPISGLAAGMVCGKSLYDINNQLMLKEGSIVQKSYIDRIRNLGYQGIYIEDAFSSDIVVRDVISDELRMHAIDMIRDICTYSGRRTRDKDVVDKKVVETKGLVETIIDQLLNQEETLINLIDLKFHDDYTFFHSVNVAVLSLLMGLEMDLDKEDLINLGLAAILHDIGKIYVRSQLLLKKGPLTAFEYEEVKRHVSFGYRFLKSSYEVPAKVYVSVLQHHERFDGKGYPNALHGDEIHLFSKIISISDVYDALTAKRPYRQSMNADQALDYILANSGTMFEEDLTSVFITKVAPYPVGTYVRLNSGHSGIVFKNYGDATRRPVVKLIVDRIGNPIKPMYVDLKNERSLKQLKIVASNESSVVEMIQRSS